MTLVKQQHVSFRLLPQSRAMQVRITGDLKLPTTDRGLNVSHNRLQTLKDNHEYLMEQWMNIGAVTLLTASSWVCTCDKSHMKIQKAP